MEKYIVLGHKDTNAHKSKDIMVLMTIKILLIIGIKEYKSNLLRNYGTYQMIEGPFRGNIKRSMCQNYTINLDF